MITIGMLLRQELSGLEVDSKAVGIDFGTQKGLVQFIQDKARSQQRTFPLIWCVIDSYDDIGDQYRAKARFFLFHNTKADFKNLDRFEETYGRILNPLYETLKAKLISSRNINIEMPIREAFKNIIDADNYGVDFVKNELTKESADFSSTAVKQSTAIAQTYLDAKFFDLTILINKKLC